MSRLGLTAKHVINTSGRPIVDVWNSRTILFQPNQEITPGTFAVVNVPIEEKDLDPTDEHTILEESLPDGSLNRAFQGSIRKAIKVSDDYASNIEQCPPGYVEDQLIPANTVPGKRLHGLQLFENVSGALDKKIVEQQNKLSRLTENANEIDSLLEDLRLAAAESDNPTIKAALERAEGLTRRVRGEEDEPMPVRPAPPMPETTRGKKRR